jgi:hypothetical protein
MMDLHEWLGGITLTKNVVLSDETANVPASSVGRTKPVVLGTVKNMRPILIDDVNYRYLAHDYTVLPFASIDTVYDDGVSVGFTDNGTGTFDLTSAPVGTITCAVSGAKFGSPAAHKTRIADICAGLLEDYLNMDAGEIDSDYITACNTDLPYDVGCAVTEQASVLDAMDLLIAGLPVWYTFTRAGVFRIGEFKAPAGSADHSIVKNENVEITGQMFGTLIKRQVIRFDHNYAPLPEDVIGGDAENQAWFSEEWRQREFKQGGVTARFPLAQDGEVKDTALQAASDAESVAEKWVELLSTPRRTYSVTVKPLGLSFELHELVTLTYDRFGLDSGQDFRIYGIEENYGSNRVTLELWG